MTSDNLNEYISKLSMPMYTQSARSMDCIANNFKNAIFAMYAVTSYDLGLEVIPKEVSNSRRQTLEAGLIAFMKYKKKHGLDNKNPQLEGKVIAYTTSQVRNPEEFLGDKDADVKAFNKYKQEKRDELKDLGVDVRDSQISLSEIKKYISQGNRVMIGLNMENYFVQDLGANINDVKKAGQDYNHVVTLVGYHQVTDSFVFEEVIDDAPSQLMSIQAKTLYDCATSVQGNQGNIEAIIFT